MTTTEKRMKEAYDRAHDLRDLETTGAGEAAEALETLLCAADEVGACVVQIESLKLDRRTTDLLDLVTAAKALYERATLELADHVCEHIEQTEAQEAHEAEFDARLARYTTSPAVAQ